MAMSAEVQIPGWNPAPLFTVTQAANSATFTIPGINGDIGYIYRIDVSLICSGFATLSCRFNGNAPTKKSGVTPWTNAKPSKFVCVPNAAPVE